MAVATEEQLELIDVDTPELKAVKRQIKDYDKLKQENKEAVSAAHEAEKAKRLKVLEAITEAKLTPGTDGVYRIKLDGTVWAISQESQLRIKKANAPKEETASEPDEEEQAEGAEQASRRGRVPSRG